VLFTIIFGTLSFPSKVGARVDEPEARLVEPEATAARALGMRVDNHFRLSR